MIGYIMCLIFILTAVISGENIETYFTTAALFYIGGTIYYAANVIAERLKDLKKSKDESEHIL